MAECPKLLPLIIVAVDVKFKKFDYMRFEIDDLKIYSRVLILDLSYLSQKSFHKAIKAVQYDHKDIRSITSFNQLMAEILFIKRKYNQEDVTVMNFVTPRSFPSLLFLIAVKMLGWNSVKYYNSGVPYVSSTKNNITIRYIAKVLKRRFYLLLSKAFDVSPTHYICAGDYWKYKYDNIANKFKIKCLSGHTWDYSNWLSKTDPNLKKALKQQNTIVLLDGAGPMFGSDDLDIGKKTYMTSEVWYPTLVSFLENIEKASNSTVDIAGHPKTLHQSNPSYFGYRNVVYGSTREMVCNSKFVITRGSTAISYAVMYKKPIIMIYSNQIKKDKLAMESNKIMSELLGITRINIDDEVGDLTSYLKVNTSCYESYKNNYLTSEGLRRTNATILLEDVLLIRTKKV